MYKIENDISNEIIINKSKFISFAYYVEYILKINDILNNLRDKYHDATHICFAYKIKNIIRFNDAGEPKGTAGMPILNVIESKELDNILIVVVRYFGGIKLGAGGLVRAYSSSASQLFENISLLPIEKEYKYRIEFDYSNVNNINYILKDYKITYKEFDEYVIYEFIAKENNYPEKLDNYIIKKIDL